MRWMKWRKETGKTVPQVALNWLLQRPTVSSVIRGRAQRGAVAAEPGRGGLESDGGAGGEAGQGERATPVYPYWHQRNFHGAESAAGVSHPTDEDLSVGTPV